jgi:hypothetical protein
MKKFCKVIFAILISFILSMSICKEVKAEVQVQDLSKVFDKATIGGEVDLFYRYDSNPWYGTLLSKLNPEWNSSPDVNWGEIYSNLRLGLTKKAPFANITAKIGAFYAETVGQDVYPVFQNTSDLEFDLAWIKFENIENSPFSLKIGRQNIFIEKKFVIGSSFQDSKAALWFAMPDSFAFAVRADGDFGPLKGTWFWARNTTYVGLDGPEAGPNLYGMNLHYDINKTAYVYGGIYYKQEESLQNGGVGNENDPINYDIGADKTFGGLHLDGEYVLQRGSSGPTGNVKLKANAYFARATYTFNNVRFTPFLQTRYTYFSGDDPNTKDNEQYDYGYGNTEWLIGELVGEAQLFQNSNKKDLMFAVGFNPTENINMRVEFLKHWLDQPATSLYGPLKSSDWAREVDMYTDWSLTDHLFMEILLGKTMPDDAAKEAFGDKDAYETYCFLSYSF